MSDYIHLTADEFASLAAKANAAQTVGYFIRNLDTLKLELHFEREAYDALSDDAKREIKSLFLWGRRSGCWISRHKEPRLIWAQRLAEKLGLADAGETGVRPSFAEQQQRKAERAEARAERFDIAADRALDRANALQKPIADMRGDIAFFTQPNINTSAAAPSPASATACSPPLSAVSTSSTNRSISNPAPPLPAKPPHRRVCRIKGSFSAAYANVKAISASSSAISKAMSRS